MLAYLEREVAKVQDQFQEIGVGLSIDDTTVMVDVKGFTIKLFMKSDYPFTCPKVYISGVNNEIWPSGGIIMVVAGSENNTWDVVTLKEDKWSPAIGLRQIILDIIVCVNDYKKMRESFGLDD